MMYSKIPLAHTLVTLCKAYGINQVVISPGSRNAPLILAFSADPFFECFSIVDERSAAFFALGLSQSSQIPPVLVCTSGSALLNYYPAVAEGFYSHIPLIVLSADRPPYKIDIGDGQTIRQSGVFENHIGYQVALSQDLTHASEAIRWESGAVPQSSQALETLQKNRQRQNESAIAEALITATRLRLPVHLNAPFEEPLYGMQDSPPVNPTPMESAPPGFGSPDWQPLKSVWEASGRKMILIGALAPGHMESDVLELLGQDPSILVFTETTSNVHHPQFFPSIDSILAPVESSAEADLHFQRLRPEVLLTLGGMIVSKKIKQFLRRYAPKAHWHIGPHNAPDTFYALKGHIKMPADDFLRSFLSKVSPGSFPYKGPWLEMKQVVEEGRRNYLEEIAFSDFKAFDQILSQIPQGMQIHLANSSTVRYSQLFRMGPEHAVYCNRGTSGIEGSTSTAVGASLASEKPTLLITGDLSFFYDINGFWNNYVRPDFRVIVINNGGGGIFRILPGTKDGTDFETFFETVQDRSIPSLCAAFGLEYLGAENTEELTAALQKFYEPSGSPKLLEVKTPRKLNDTVLLGYFDFLSCRLPNIL
ncbi:MAG: thiamine pyrophosphate-binding protein [Robiginitalea sp.]|uniref:2-succinyl-5-enolpyruvyl-6-hydroxy-3- cyclohexene-1-carboxylate synthase n=2 Tax=Robiginitalea sp. TaxID=1902411 RepID=UPI003C769CEF